jgi:tRNA(adenine34) deaminase
MVSMDEQMMGLALETAQAAAAAGEVPVGAVVVHGDRIIGRAHNLRETEQDPTAHAEIVALREAARALGSWRLNECTLYVTLEPCPMCIGAAVNARLRHLVFGCSDPKAGAVGTLYNIADDRRLNHRIEVRSGVLAEESAAVLRAFFAARRRGRGAESPSPGEVAELVEGA